MGKQNANYLTAIDLGSAKTIAFVAEITDSGVRYIGHGQCETKGFRKGIIVDLDKTIASVQKAVEDAENACGAAISLLMLAIVAALSVFYVRQMLRVGEEQ